MLRIHLTLLFCFSCQFALADEWVQRDGRQDTRLFQTTEVASFSRNK